MKQPTPNSGCSNEKMNLNTKSVSDMNMLNCIAYNMSLHCRQKYLLHYIMSRQKMNSPSNSTSSLLHLVLQKGQKNSNRQIESPSFHAENLINLRLQCFCDHKVITQKLLQQGYSPYDSHSKGNICLKNQQSKLVFPFRRHSEMSPPSTEYISNILGH